MSRRNFEAVVMDTVCAVIHVEYVFIAHILINILHKYYMRNSYHLSMMYVTVHNMKFNRSVVFWPRSKTIGLPKSALKSMLIKKEKKK